ncbi:MAG TPA: SufE family protein [Caulobacterales bacterium]|nr:SufE family protein [Caulobacterales bacterium]
MSASEPDRAVDEIADEFGMLSDWEERYAHVLDLGRTLAPLSEAEHSDANKVRGCASQVWLVTENGSAPGRLAFRGDSDAHIVRGLIAVLLRIFSDRTPGDILTADPKAIFARLGLAEALSPQRSNGLFSMIERIRADARAAEHVA